MKKLRFILTICILSVLSYGCAVTLPVAAKSNEVSANDKVGTATATGYLGVLFFDQDASIREAAKNGGITKISTVDIKTKNILNLITIYETIVRGQ